MKSRPAREKIRVAIIPKVSRLMRKMQWLLPLLCDSINTLVATLLWSRIVAIPGSKLLKLRGRMLRSLFTFRVPASLIRLGPERNTRLYEFGLLGLEFFSQGEILELICVRRC